MAQSDLALVYCVCPQYLLNRLQKVQSNATGLNFKALKTDHVTPHLRTLHWLPIDARIGYNICSRWFGAVTSTDPVYPSDLLKIYTPSWQSDLPPTAVHCAFRLSTLFRTMKALSHSAPTLWNTLPTDVRFSQSASSAFKVPPFCNIVIALPD